MPASKPLSRFQRYHRRHQSDPKYRARRSALAGRWSKEHKARRNEINKKYFRKLRHEAIMAYGGYHCSCPGCSITEAEFLGLDHIKGGGRKHRAQAGHHNFYMWLKKLGYPPGLRVMCHNCNLARGFYGSCPHERAEGGAK